MVKIFLEVSPMREKVKIDFLAVYSEMRSTLKGLKFDRQIDLVMKSLNMTYQSASNSLKEISDYRKALDNIKVDEHSKIEQGNIVYDEKYIGEFIENFNKPLTESIE